MSRSLIAEERDSSVLAAYCLTIWRKFSTSPYSTAMITMNLEILTSTIIFCLMPLYAFTNFHCMARFETWSPLDISTHYPHRSACNPPKSIRFCHIYILFFDMSTVSSIHRTGPELESKEAVPMYWEAIVVSSFLLDVYFSGAGKRKVVSMETTASISSQTGSDVIQPRFESNDIIVLSSDWLTHMPPCHLLGISLIFRAFGAERSFQLQTPKRKDAILLTSCTTIYVITLHRLSYVAMPQETIY